MMMKDGVRTEITTYKDLFIWQKGIELVKEVYSLCEFLPKEEMFALQSQLKRSAVSVPSNIAEGYGRNYTQNFIQFLKIARGSLLELETQLIISMELGYIVSEKFETVYEMIQEEHKMLNAFIRSIESSKN